MTEVYLTLDQQRAKHSLQKINQIRAKIEEEQKSKIEEQESTEKKKTMVQKGDEYASYVVRLPVDILTNGLGQALAQLLAAAKDQQEEPHRWLYQDLQDWLCRSDPLAPYPNEKDLLEAIVTYDRKKYQQALSEAMAWLKWHTKIAVAQLKKTEDESYE